MTNLEWFNEIGMIAENEVWTKTSDLKGQIGVNLVIALRDDDFKKYSERFWLAFGRTQRTYQID